MEKNCVERTNLLILLKSKLGVFNKLVNLRKVTDVREAKDEIIELCYEGLQIASYAKFIRLLKNPTLMPIESELRAYQRLNWWKLLDKKDLSEEEFSRDVYPELWNKKLWRPGRNPVSFDHPNETSIINFSILDETMYFLLVERTISPKIRIGLESEPDDVYVLSKLTGKVTHIRQQ